ncbi:MAG: CheR family methyltransferase [Rhodothermales bacterium]
MAGFFQVPEAFAALDRHVIPTLFEGRSAADTIRVWVAGCSTGEEAYSVAILLFEYASRLEAAPQIKIFASDNDQEALRVARHGVYPDTIRAQMSGQCLETYFIRQPDGYIVSPAVRDAVSFSTHDVLIDHAFQTLDLITCRHLLGVLEKESQGQIISFFHHALRQQGYLFLGDKEFADGLPQAFEPVDDVHQIYRHSASARVSDMDFFDEVLDEETVFPPELTLQPEDLVEARRTVMAGEENRHVFAANVVSEEEPDSDLVIEIPGAMRKDKEDIFAMAPVSSGEPHEVAPDPLHPDMAMPDAALGDEMDEVVADEPEAAASDDLPAVSLEALPPIEDTEAQAASDGAVEPDEPEATPEPSTAEQPIAEQPVVEPSVVESSIVDKPVHEKPVHEKPARPRSGESVFDDAFGPLSESDGMAGLAESIRSVPSMDNAGSAGEHPPRKGSEAPAEGDGLIQGAGVAPQALVRLHQEHLVKHYMPPSLLVDEQNNILHVSGDFEGLFRVRHFHLERDYLEQLPAVYRRRVSKAIQQAFFERDPAKVETVVIPSHELGNIPLRVQYLEYNGSRLDVVQLVFEGRGHDAARGNLGIRLSVPDAGAEKVDNAVIVDGIEDALARLILVGPYPMLLHAEGGTILEMNKPWVELSAYPVGETTTLTAWTKLVRGQRIQLKDPKLAEQYSRKGVECVSIRTRSGDTRLLALHSVSLGKDRRNRKLTLTMAMDISGHAGQYGVNLVAHGADDASRAKSAFLANVSHEIRTPLTSMIGFAEHLASKLSGQDMQFARYISDSGYRLLETLNAILRMASYEGVEKQDELSIELIDITLECQGLLQLFKPQADQYDIPLKMVIKEPVKAYLDRAAFRRVVGNIIGNAIKFTRRGEVTITVSTESDMVRVEVDDTGIGISDAFKPFIFDRFTQETKGEGRSYAGCGLGLAVAKHLCEKMGGTIGVESQLGVGSKFIVRLPIGSQDSGKAVFGESQQPAGLIKKRVLVIEDDLDTQELMLLLLRDRYEVTVTSNATEALQKAQQDEYDVMLMDLNLGGTRSGFELLADVRRLDGYQSVPVLAVSALPIDAIRKQLIKSGFNGYIAKPFTRARVYDALENVLGKEG